MRANSNTIQALKQIGEIGTFELPSEYFPFLSFILSLSE